MSSSGEVTFWEELPWAEKQDQWLQQAKSIATQQDQHKPQRLELATRSKEFARLPKEAQPAAVRGLVRRYQLEIDRLSKATAFAENAFLSVYRDFGDAPAPSLALSSLRLSSSSSPSSPSLGRSGVSEETERLRQENKELTASLESFRTEVQYLRDQELTIRKLEGRLQSHEEEQERLVQLAVEEKVMSLHDEYMVREAKWSERGEEAERLRGEAVAAHLAEKSKVKNLQHSLQLANTELTSTSLKLQSELDLALSENERLLTLIPSTDTPDELLPSSGTTTSPQYTEALRELELSIVSKDLELSRVGESLLSLQKEKEREKETHSRLIDELRARVEAESLSVKNLTEELQSRPETTKVLQLQERLKILSALAPGDGDGDGAALSSIEDALRLKSQKLSTEVVTLKAALADSRLLLREAQAQSKLSEDRQGVTPPESPSLSQELTPDVVAAQRTLYRNRSMELETTVSELKQHNLSATAELNRVKSDNVELLGRIKYLQNFSRSSSPASLESGAAVGAEKRYEALYEHSVNPFTSFHKQEKLQRYKSMNVLERTTLRLSQFFLATQSTRLILFAYILFMHLLVFASLWVSVHR